jgi:hypothetical protein
MFIHFFFIKVETMAEEIEEFIFFTWTYCIKFYKPTATLVLTLPQLSHNSENNLDDISTNTALHLGHAVV